MVDNPGDPDLMYRTRDNAQKGKPATRLLEPLFGQNRQADQVTTSGLSQGNYVHPSETPGRDHDTSSGFHKSQNFNAATVARMN